MVPYEITCSIERTSPMKPRPSILIKEFGGVHLADGEVAARIRASHIEPHLSSSDEVTLDFSGVRNANSSFMNALVAGVVEQHGEAILDRLVFKGCNPVLRVLIESAHRPWSSKDQRPYRRLR